MWLTVDFLICGSPGRIGAQGSRKECHRLVTSSAAEAPGGDRLGHLRREGGWAAFLEEQSAVSEASGAAVTGEGQRLRGARPPEPESCWHELLGGQGSHLMSGASSLSWPASRGTGAVAEPWPPLTMHTALGKPGPQFHVPENGAARLVVRTKVRTA